jgi:hypothetical protein
MSTALADMSTTDDLSATDDDEIQPETIPQISIEDPVGPPTAAPPTIPQISIEQPAPAEKSQQDISNDDDQTDFPFGKFMSWEAIAEIVKKKIPTQDEIDPELFRNCNTIENLFKLSKSNLIIALLRIQNSIFYDDPDQVETSVEEESLSTEASIEKKNKFLPNSCQSNSSKIDLKLFQSLLFKRIDHNKKKKFENQTVYYYPCSFGKLSAETHGGFEKHVQTFIFFFFFFFFMFQVVHVVSCFFLSLE